MKSKSNAKSFFNKALTNKYVLYVIAFIAFLYLLQHIMSKEFTAVILFYLVGLVTYYYSKNMTVVLGVSFLATLFADLVKSLLNIREGFKEKNDHKKTQSAGDSGDTAEDAAEDAATANATATDDEDAKDAVEDAATATDDEDAATATDTTSSSLDGFKNKKAKKSGYQNQLKLNPSLYNMPNKKQMKKQLGDASTLESAYDNLEKVIGDNGIKSLSGNTENLIKKQNKLMKQMKEITPTLQNAMESVSKIDLGKISKLMTNIGDD